MKFNFREAVILLGMLLLPASGVLAGPKQEESRTFEGIESIRINTVVAGVRCSGRAKTDGIKNI